MVNLIKYEFIRKSRLLGISFAITLIINASVLIKLLTGTPSFEQQMIALAVFFSFTLMAFFILFIVDVVIMCSMDLNQKSGYMLFLTPNSGFKILGSKVITGILEGLLFLAFFFLLVLVNFKGFYGEPLSQFLSSDFFQIILGNIHIEKNQIFPLFTANLLTLFFAIVTLIMTILAAICIRKSILAQIKFGGLLSFILFLVLVRLNGAISQLVVSGSPGMVINGTVNYTGIIGEMMVQIVYGALLFLLSGYLLEKKMDL